MLGQTEVTASETAGVEQREEERRHRAGIDATAHTAPGATLVVGGLTVLERAVRQLRHTGYHPIVVTDGTYDLPRRLQGSVETRRAKGPEHLSSLFPDFGGIPHADWEKGSGFARGTEDRAHTCPAWWWQMVDYKRKPRWDECLAYRAFSSCKHFANKAACWERHDREYPEREPAQHDGA